MSEAIIESLSYVLGEESHSINSVPNMKEIFEEYNYPDLPDMFGWGQYRQTAMDVFDLGIKSAKKTLDNSSVSADEVDVVYFCSTCIPGNEIQHIGFNVRLLTELELTNAFPVGVTLNNCVSFLNAITMATKLVESNVYRNALIITADKVYDEYARLNNFALLSDSAASCIVTSSSDASGFRLLAESFRASNAPIKSYEGKDDSELYIRVLQEVLKRSSITKEDIEVVLCSNIFKPITQQKERKLGFKKNQLFQDNVSKYGHCFSADTILNLSDYVNGKNTSNGSLYMLSADAPNLRASVILQSTAA